MAERKAGFSKYLGLTFLIGFGFFTMGLMDPLYDTYVPKFLGDHISSMTLVGLIMTLDNILAIFLIPIVTVWSDRTRSRLGRRMPWIIALLPPTAVCFALLPYSAPVLMSLIVLVFLLNIFKQAARGPVVALMPDLVPGDLRSEANGVINTMGGIAAIVGTLILAPLMNVKAVLPLIGQVEGRLPFVLAGILVVLAAILVFALIRENKLFAAAGNKPEEKPLPVIQAIKKAVKGNRGALLILVSLFLWFIGYQGVLPYIGKYAMETIGVSKGLAAFGAGAVGVAYAIFAIPSGYVAHRIGRKKAIRFALAALVVVSFLLFAFDLSLRGGIIPSGIGFPVYLGILFVFGVFWVTVVTNSFPMLWQMAGQDTMGIYTGLYYTSSQLAAIVAPPLSGAIIDAIRTASISRDFLEFFRLYFTGGAVDLVPAKVGYPGMFVLCALAMAAAFAVMAFVKGGEPEASSHS
jgi:maltose/moltooligosaccharide transporter